MNTYFDSSNSTFTATLTAQLCDTTAFMTLCEQNARWIRELVGKFTTLNVPTSDPYQVFERIAYLRMHVLSDLSISHANSIIRRSHYGYLNERFGDTVNMVEGVSNEKMTYYYHHCGLGDLTISSRSVRVRDTLVSPSMRFRYTLGKLSRKDLSTLTSCNSFWFVPNVSDTSNRVQSVTLYAYRGAEDELYTNREYRNIIDNRKVVSNVLGLHYNGIDSMHSSKSYLLNHFDLSKNNGCDFYSALASFIERNPDYHVAIDYNDNGNTSSVIKHIVDIVGKPRMKVINIKPTNSDKCFVCGDNIRIHGIGCPMCNLHPGVVIAMMNQALCIDSNKFVKFTSSGVDVCELPKVRLIDYLDSIQLECIANQIK